MHIIVSPLPVFGEHTGELYDKRDSQDFARGRDYGYTGIRSNVSTHRHELVARLLRGDVVYDIFQDFILINRPDITGRITIDIANSDGNKSCR